MDDAAEGDRNRGRRGSIGLVEPRLGEQRNKIVAGVSEVQEERQPASELRCEVELRAKGQPLRLGVGELEAGLVEARLAEGDEARLL